ncbi:MAG: PorP/SprF family type IX secretion system membrane protein [Flavobacteriales bacterium]
MNTKLKLVIALSCFYGAVFAQQEIQYTQNILNSHLLINPAYSGVFGEHTVGLKFRNQWDKLPGSPQSFIALGELPIKENLNLGIVFNHDVIGINTSDAIEISPSTQLKVSDNSKLSLGLKVGFHHLDSDFSRLVGVDITDPLYANRANNSTYFGAGALYYNPKFYIGLSSPRIVNFESKSAGDKYLKNHFYLYGGSKIKLDEQFDLRPQLLLKSEFKADLVAEISSQLWFENKVGLGVGYRSGDAVSASLQMEFKKMTFGYSYDITTSSLREHQNGSHEFFVGIKLKKSKPEKEGEEPVDRSTNQRYF